MLFNSFAFLLFLPLVLLLYTRLARRGSLQATLSALALCSLLFYGVWNPVYLLLLLGSVGVNYLLARRIWRDVASVGRGARRWLLLGVAVNLGLLGYFKYTGLLLDTVNLALDLSLPSPDIVLPLAISFFTFQQIALLADARQGKVAPVGITEYLLFVTFFPQLIAGPIVHHAEMMPQFRQAADPRDRLLDYQLGLSLFAMGLAKKVLLADNLAPIADLAFAAADAGNTLPWALAAMGV
ncbi:MAG: MBOAT family O-acyltransferase, partial [Halieaceae bacterium]|nr:MBOAT family O-acyltransferase [Halieaceae bacterium]